MYIAATDKSNLIAGGAMDFLISASTDIGNARKTNQDSCCVKLLSAGELRMVFAVLCDGMGGLKKGEAASASVLHAYRSWSEQRLPMLLAAGLSERSLYRDWCEIAIRCNDHIRSYGRRCEICLGTTALVMLITQQRYYIMNVGDSRAYEITDACRLLTQDQTVVAREVQMGFLTRQQARFDPRRGILLQCIGASEEVYPALFSGNTGCDAVYMLCSDGFRHEISEDEIYRGFHPSQMRSTDAMKRKEQELIALNRERKERDNISVITIRTYG